jgi:hypothetical protein
VTHTTLARAWMSPDIADDAGRPWYRMESMRRAGVLVEIVLPVGARHVAQVKRWPQPSSPLWWVLGSGEQLGRYLDHTALQRAARPPHWHPVYWRPLPGVVWPDALGEPLAATPYVTPPPPRPHIVEPPEPAASDWPHPGLALGCLAPPRSVEECEARVLRAWRTMNSPGVVQLDNPGRSVSNLLSVLTRLIYDIDGAQSARRRRRSDDEPEHVDHTVGDVRVAFVPTRRDLTDWPYALDWLMTLTPRAQQIVRLRAANPVHSWWQVADQVGLKSHSSAMTAYKRAVVAMYHAAKGD